MNLLYAVTELTITKVLFVFQQSSLSQVAFLLLLTSEDSLNGNRRLMSRLLQKKEAFILRSLNRSSIFVKAGLLTGQVKI